MLNVSKIHPALSYEGVSLIGIFRGFSYVLEGAFKRRGFEWINIVNAIARAAQSVGL
jgi:hypothetical protein